MKVLFCASEVAPFEKTGGLADVAGSLPLALAKLGVESVVMMPRYRGLPQEPERLADKVTVHFIEQEEYFNRAALYGNERGDYPDNLLRFSFFCDEALRRAKALDFRPDIVHAHDWQTALMPVFLKTRPASDDFYARTKTLLTIHNLAYQGQFPAKMFQELRLDQKLFSIDGFEFYGRVNLLKAGLLYADAISTVSPTYAKEIQTQQFGYGLEGVIRKRADRLAGILNGLDYDLWDPAKDAKIAAMYSPDSPAGKTACKADLQKLCGFPVDPDVPLFGIVTRLAEQKGLDILSEICDKLLSKNVQFAMLGDGDPVYKTTFRNVQLRHPKKASVHIGFNAIEAHKIYAGADFFLMPSYFEPCGLGQLISLKYGTLPIVRRTGGLADTIIDAGDDAARGNGFVFAEHSPEKFLKAIERALAVYADKPQLEALKSHAMREDFSWGKSAKAYVELYERMMKS